MAGAGLSSEAAAPVGDVVSPGDVVGTKVVLTVVATVVAKVEAKVSKSG